MIYSIGHNCVPHAFQDKEFGANRRAFTLGSVKGGRKMFCTVCGASEPARGTSREEKDEAQREAKKNKNKDKK